MRSADRRRVAGLVVIVLAALAVPSSGQDGQRPSEVEAALRRRVEAWLRDRGQKGLACKACDCVADRVQRCGDCERTGVDRRKARAALWRYMPPSFRRQVEEERWTREVLQGSKGQWGDGPFAAAGLVVDDVIATRDAAWAWHRPPTEGAPATATMWIREGDGFFLAPSDGTPVDPLLVHGWFVAGSFSLHDLRAYLARLEQAVADPSATDLERERRAAAKTAEERALRQRVLADVGRLQNVRRAASDVADALGVRKTTFVVTVVVGVSSVAVFVPTLTDADARATEERLAALPVGARVAVRGRIGSWVAAAQGPWFETLDLQDGDVVLVE